jgi:hypothetical protein
MDLKERGFEYQGMVWTHVAEDRDKYQSVVNTVVRQQ